MSRKNFLAHFSDEICIFSNKLVLMSRLKIEITLQGALEYRCVSTVVNAQKIAYLDYSRGRIVLLHLDRHLNLKILCVVSFAK
jgi:hypothetical protein